MDNYEKIVLKEIANITHKKVSLQDRWRPLAIYSDLESALVSKYDIKYLLDQSYYNTGTVGELVGYFANKMKEAEICKTKYEKDLCLAFSEILGVSINNKEDIDDLPWNGDAAKRFLLPAINKKFGLNWDFSDIKYKTLRDIANYLMSVAHKNGSLNINPKNITVIGRISDDDIISFTKKVLNDENDDVVRNIDSSMTFESLAINDDDGLYLDYYAISEEYGVTFDGEEENFVTIGDLVDFIKDHLPSNLCETAGAAQMQTSLEENIVPNKKNLIMSFSKVETCPKCGNVVDGKIKRSTISKGVRGVIKKGGMKATLAAAGTVVPGFGTVPGFLVGAAIDAVYGDKINNLVDKTADSFIKDEQYEFSCPKCGHKWTSHVSIDNRKMDVDVNDELFSKMKLIIQDKLGVDESEITPNAIIVNDLGADDLDTVELVMEYEKAFGISISDEEGEQIVTVGDAYHCIMSHLSEENYEENDEDDEDEEDDDDTTLEAYFYYRKRSCIEHYVNYLHTMEFTTVEELYQRIAEDTGAEVELTQEDNLTDILMDEVDWDLCKWHNFITTLPHGGNDEPFHLNIYYYGTDDEVGVYLIGVIESGSIATGDIILLCAENEEPIPAKIEKVELFEKILDEAEAGDSVGLIIDVDPDLIPSELAFAIKEGEQQEAPSSPNSLTAGEQEYLNEYQEMKADSEISDRDRRFLEKIRKSNGISEARAKQLEEMAELPAISEGEQEYLKEYREMVSEGELSERDRRFLEKIRQTNGITEERVKQLEALVEDNA